jgi:hypothetical protein
VLVCLKLSIPLYVLAEPVLGCFFDLAFVLGFCYGVKWLEKAYNGGDWLFLAGFGLRLGFFSKT